MGLLDWEDLAADYGRYHRTRGNQRCHLIGIPLIVMAIMAWTRWPEGSLVPMAAALLPVYYVWDVRLAVAVTAMTAGLTYLGSMLSGTGIAAAFVAGWIFQLVGHKVYEGKSPAFTRNLVHLFVGPAWILDKHLPLR